jgi:small GTP-binding protein
MPSVRREKIVLLGDAAVGKTSMIRRFVHATFDEKYISTMGTNVSKKTLFLDGPDGPVELIQTIWDVVGQSDFQSVQRVALRGARGLLAVADASRRDTFENIPYWLYLVDEATGPIPTVLVVNKWDLADERVITQEDMEEFATKVGVPYLLTSAKTGEGVEDAFAHLGRELLHRRRPSYKGIDHPPPRPADPVLALEDRLIAKFCEEAGNVEAFMPIVRHQFRTAGIDWKRPSPQQLHQVVDRLVAVALPFRGPEEAQRIRGELMRILRQHMPSASP